MSLPQLLLVDDSEAILAYERAALAGHYAVSTATNGKAALQKLREVKPAAVLLDLSMPEMSGDEVLAAMKLDPALADIPVLVISSEKSRGEACLKAGADGLLVKPIRAEDLREQLERLLERARSRQSQGSLAVLPVTVGEQSLAFPLRSVVMVSHQPETTPLPVGPGYLSELVDVHGEPTFVLDLARRLGLTHARALRDRMLVVIRAEAVQLAVCVDDVRDPEVFPKEQVTYREALGGAQHGGIAQVLIATALTPGGMLPVLDPAALVTPALLRELPGLLASHRGNAP